jgi:nucleotidyltransferase substrate binding protein (TIGR01987 family)
MTEDIRWIQRFSNFEKAFSQLKEFIEKGELNKFEEQGLIQCFEFTHELAWNVMKDYFYFQENSSITGSRDATREAFQKGLIENGEEWMEMIKSRNQSSHTYNQETAQEIINKIQNSYYHLFELFLEKMTSLK